MSGQFNFNGPATVIASHYSALSVSCYFSCTFDNHCWYTDCLNLITRSLSKLISAVSAIENQTYDSSQILTQSDELGQLSKSLDSMYQTIQQQIEQIKLERQAKYNAEIRLFSEQINPHFLYNTLEYINMKSTAITPKMPP